MHQLTVMLMARPRGPNEPSTYENQPEVPPELKKRFDLIRAVIGDQTTISEAARELGIARVNMQTLVHRVERAIVSALQPRSTGPTPAREEEKKLKTRVAQLEKENAKLKRQLQAADDMMGAAGEIIRALRGLPPRSSTSSSRRSPRRSSKKSESPSDPESEPATLVTTRALARISTSADTCTWAARALGIGCGTLRRWLSRLARGEPITKPRGGKRKPVTTTAEQSVRTQVRELAGMVGAASLAHSVNGVSRRQAAEIKRDELAALERERKAACAHVKVTRPGVVRGFDAMHLRDGYGLIACDASVAYRTSGLRVPAYDEKHVAAALARDFEEHGAPLVVRLDRASCQRTKLIASQLEAYGVLALHGPAYHAQYYGQLERQNREHRCWLDYFEASDQESLSRMIWALNRIWRRPTLDWRTAEELWSAREPVDDDRQELRDEVHDRAARLRRDCESDLAMRLAIEQALIKRGYLRITPGRQPLCEQPV